MPLFGKKKETAPVLNKPRFVQHKEYSIQGPTSCLAMDKVHDKEVVIASALNSRGFIVMGIEENALWSFDTGATVYGLAVANSAATNYSEKENKETATLPRCPGVILMDRGNLNPDEIVIKVAFF